MRIVLGVPVTASVLITSAAWAIYGQPVIITGEGADEIPAQSISFLTPSGEAVPVEEDDDDGFIILFPGDFATSGQLIIDLPDGQRVIDVPMAGPGETLVIDLDSGMATSRPDAPMAGLPSAGLADAQLPVGLSYDFFQLELPAIGFGTEITGGSTGEEPVAALDGGVDISGGSLDFAFPLPALSFADFGFVSVLQASGDDEAQGSVAAGGNSVAITYQDFSPANSTGLFLGSLGLDAWTQREVDVFNFKAGLGWAPVPISADGQTQFYPAAFFDYGAIDTDVTSNVTTPAYNDISQTTELSIEQRILALGFGGVLTRPLTENVSVGTGLFGLVVNSETDFSSMQYNVCGVCGPDSTFNSAVYQTQDSTTLGFKGSAMLDIGITDNIALSLQAHATYLDPIAGAWVPTSGDDLFVDNRPAEIVEDADWITGGRVGIRLRF